MVKLKLYRCIYSKLPPELENGALYLVTDKHELYFDTDVERIRIADGDMLLSEFDKNGDGIIDLADMSYSVDGLTRQDIENLVYGITVIDCGTSTSII